MQAIELFAELFHSARVRVLPRLIRTPAHEAMLRKGLLGSVEGIIIGEGGACVMALETQAGTVHIEFDGEPAAEALKALMALPVNFPQKYRRADLQREHTSNFDRDASDLRAAGQFKGGG